MIRKILILLVLFQLSEHQKLLAQKEDSNWHFGRQAAVSFVTGSPVVETKTAMLTYEASSSISDKTGKLLFYSNGEKVWNSNHTLMPNGGAISSSGFSSTQGALIVPHPGDPGLYYLFLTDDIEHQLMGGLRYVVVDMRLANGQGDVSRAATRLPTPTLTSKVAEKLVAVQHANGRDYWIVVHGWENNNFYSFLLSTDGLINSPVISGAGPVLDDIGGRYPYYTATGYLRAAPDSRHLAMASGNRDFELYDFDPATGVVSNYVALPALVSDQPYHYGVEFSPNGTRLYFRTSAPDLNFSLLQFDMMAGSGAAIAASRQVVGKGKTDGGALLRANDGKIYMAGSTYLHVVDKPNELGAACNFKLNAVFLAGASTGYNLPNFPNAFSKQALLSYTSAVACPGSATVFTGRVGIPDSNFSLSWDFGDPLAGSNNTASGLNSVHTFTKSGIYTVTLTLTAPTQLTPISVSQQVEVPPIPVVSLGHSPQLLCTGSSLILSPGPQPAGSSYRWQDGSTAPTYRVVAPGDYSVVVATAQGCTAQATTQVQLSQLPEVTLGPSLQKACANQPYLLATNPQPAGTTYSWQDGSTKPTFQAVAPGVYSVTVTAATGCTTQASMRLEWLPLPTIQLGPDTVACLEEKPLILHVQGAVAGSRFQWNDGTTESNCVAITAGLYSVIVTTPDGCVAQAQRHITNGNCPILIPNVITPNSDKKNDTFVLKGLNSAAWGLTLFNRWGSEIYRTTSYDNSWNATGQPDGVYYYLLKNSTTKQQYRGWVQVIR